MSYRLNSPGLEGRQGKADKCPRCGKGPLAEDSNTGEFYCTNCGYVMKEKLEETRPEWRSFQDEQGGESRARTGMPTSITSFDMGLSTVIGSVEPRRLGLLAVGRHEAHDGQGEGLGQEEPGRELLRQEPEDRRSTR